MTENTGACIVIAFFLIVITLSCFCYGAIELCYYFNNKKLAKKEQQSKKDFPEYFAKRKKWYRMFDAVSEHNEKISKQKEKIKKLTEERVFIPTEDLSKFDYVLEVEKHQLKTLLLVWDSIFAEWESKSKELWEELEKEREEKNITIFNER